MIPAFGRLAVLILLGCASSVPAARLKAQGGKRQCLDSQSAETGGSRSLLTTRSLPTETLANILSFAVGRRIVTEIETAKPPSPGGPASPGAPGPASNPRGAADPCEAGANLFRAQKHLFGLSEAEAQRQLVMAAATHSPFVLEFVGVLGSKVGRDATAALCRLWTDKDFLRKLRRTHQAAHCKMMRIGPLPISGQEFLHRDLWAAMNSRAEETIRNGRFAAVVACGGDLERQGGPGRTMFPGTILAACAQKGVVHDVHVLLAAGANPNTRNGPRPQGVFVPMPTTPLHAVLHGTILSVGPRTRFRMLNVMRLLLSYGADPNRMNDTGIGPLHLAVIYGNEGATRVLLEEAQCRADPNIQCHPEEKTPLHLAASCGQIALVRLLVANGADETAQDREGLTALACALDDPPNRRAHLLEQQLAGQREVVRFLQRPKTRQFRRGGQRRLESPQ